MNSGWNGGAGPAPLAWIEMGTSPIQRPMSISIHAPVWRSSEGVRLTFGGSTGKEDGSIVPDAIDLDLHSTSYGGLDDPSSATAHYVLKREECDKCVRILGNDRISGSGPICSIGAHLDDDAAKHRRFFEHCFLDVRDRRPPHVPPNENVAEADEGIANLISDRVRDRADGAAEDGNDRLMVLPLPQPALECLRRYDDGRQVQRNCGRRRGR